MKNEQEIFWQSEFGNDYTERNNDCQLRDSKKNYYEKIFERMEPINNLIEVGCNRGINLEIIKQIHPNIELNGIEINKYACEILQKNKICKNIYNSSILDYNNNQTYDLVLTMGVLIHLNPQSLNDVYEKMVKLSNKYILIGEYYSRDIREINYRGNDNKLFKRDFCGELLDKYENLKLIDYGFIYHRDLNYPLDDISWFLMEKINN
jgi:pseudaminic acid biosynthesis-associated methylase